MLEISIFALPPIEHVIILRIFVPLLLDLHKTGG
jgi:hypothetical protein